MFFAFIAGRPQNLLQLKVSINSDTEYQPHLNVFWSNFPKRANADDEKQPSIRDILIDAVRDPIKFSSILKYWLDQQQNRQDSRFRFHNSFSQQKSYSIDRLIGSANMFDLFPDSATLTDLQISEEMTLARDKSHDLFKALPISDERNMILGALGRIGKNTLKQKIRHRAKLISDVLAVRFPDLSIVTDEAVNCRNHYVHGGQARIDYNGNFDLVIFFTDALEFIFAASELIEAGWDIDKWYKRHSSLTHPFDMFCFGYARHLELLNVILSKKGTPP